LAEIQFDNPTLERKNGDRVRTIVGAQLEENIRDVVLDRGFCDRELVGDLLIPATIEPEEKLPAKAATNGPKLTVERADMQRLRTGILSIRARPAPAMCLIPHRGKALPRETTSIRVVGWHRLGGPLLCKGFSRLCEWNNWPRS